MKILKNKPLMIVLSIILGFVLLRIGYEAKNDTVSIVVQSLGYISVSYSFILFIKVFIDQIRYDIKNRKR
jgi:hypothetical protein